MNQSVLPRSFARVTIAYRAVPALTIVVWNFFFSLLIYYDFLIVDDIFVIGTITIAFLIVFVFIVIFVIVVIAISVVKFFISILIFLLRSYAFFIITAAFAQLISACIEEATAHRVVLKVIHVKPRLRLLQVTLATFLVVAI